MTVTTLIISLLLIVSLELHQVTSVILKPKNPIYCSEKKPCPNCETCISGTPKSFCLEFSACSSCERCNKKTKKCEANRGPLCKRSVNMCIFAKCGRCYRCNPATGCEPDPNQKHCDQPITPVIPIAPTFPSNKCDDERCSKCRECNRVTGECELKICGVRKRLDPETCICENYHVPPPADNQCLTVKCSRCHECDPVTGECVTLKCPKCYYCDEKGLSGACEPNPLVDCVGRK